MIKVEPYEFVCPLCGIGNDKPLLSIQAGAASAFYDSNTHMWVARVTLAGRENRHVLCHCLNPKCENFYMSTYLDLDGNTISRVECAELKSVYDRYHD